jgi:hypothetical protein
VFEIAPIRGDLTDIEDVVVRLDHGRKPTHRLVKFALRQLPLVEHAHYRVDVAAARIADRFYRKRRRNVAPSTLTKGEHSSSRLDTRMLRNTGEVDPTVKQSRALASQTRQSQMAQKQTTSITDRYIEHDLNLRGIA